MQLDARAVSTQLTPREKEVVTLMVQGMRNKEIAARLGIRQHTAAVHMRNIFVKLNVCDRTRAVVPALLRGIVHLDE